MMIKRVIVALLIGQISGCLFVPIATPEFGEAPIEPEQIAVIEAGVGRINRDFVLESIGQSLLLVVAAALLFLVAVAFRRCRGSKSLGLES